MPAYPTLNDIEVRWRTTGSGVCVIVEGETERDDPWFFQRWFGDRARDVTFFPRDGWELVIQSVTDLRARAALGVKKVYGIVDRDFEIPVYSPFPTDGILRLRKYTLENYLLDPGIWFAVVQPFLQRNPKPGWRTEAEIQTTIETLYRDCIPLAAYNWTLHTAQCQNPNAIYQSSANDWAYAAHPQTLREWNDIPARLQALQARAGISENLAQLYTNRLTALQSEPIDQLETFVTGKVVLKLLREAFPLRVSGKPMWDSILGAYMHYCLVPPPDLSKLVDVILENAHA